MCADKWEKLYGGTTVYLGDDEMAKDAHSDAAPLLKKLPVCDRATVNLEDILSSRVQGGGALQARPVNYSVTILSIIAAVVLIGGPGPIAIRILSGSKVGRLWHSGIHCFLLTWWS